MTNAHRDQGLEAAYRSMSEGAQTTDECPSPEKLWAGVCGELTGQEMEQIAEHMSRCGACAEDWRTSKAIADDMNASNDVTQDPSHDAKIIAFPFRRAIAPVLAIAAALLIFFLLPEMNPEEPETQYRNSQQVAIVSLLSQDPLPRDNCKLSWELVNPVENVTYKVVVTLEDPLDVIFKSENLTETNVTIDASALAGIPNGGSIFWSVEATYPDGRKQRSATYEQVLAAP